jgi:hypothetical protein
MVGPDPEEVRVRLQELFEPAKHFFHHGGQLGITRGLLQQFANLAYGHWAVR